MRVFPFLNNLKDLDPSYKMDLDFWIVLERKTLSYYNHRNTVFIRVGNLIELKFLSVECVKNCFLFIGNHAWRK